MNSAPALQLSWCTLVTVLTGASSLRAQPCDPNWMGGFTRGDFEGDVRALCTWDPDGGGPLPAQLYAGGSFSRAGGVSVGRVATWNGTSWAPLGSGVAGTINTAVVFDEDGAGPAKSALYVGGTFTTAGTVFASRVARWDGAAWSSLPEGLNSEVNSLVVWDPDGNGPQSPLLVAGGWFTKSGTIPLEHVAAWNGQTWAALGAGFSGNVDALGILDVDGAGPIPPRLFASASSLIGLAEWDGATWTSVIPLQTFAPIIQFDPDGDGPELPGLALGHSGVFFWDEANLTELGSLDGPVEAIAALDHDGLPSTAPLLVATGQFMRAGQDSLARIAAWDGETWTALGDGLNGNGRALLAVDDSDPQIAAGLYVGGEFGYAGDTPAGRIARWNANEWSAVGSGSLGGGLSGHVSAVELHDFDGAGPAPVSIVMGGKFVSAGGVDAVGAAAWDGAAWKPLGKRFDGINGEVYALRVFDADGTGPDLPRLYAGGDFGLGDWSPNAGFVAWGGEAWQLVAGNANGQVHAFEVFDPDGSGPVVSRLYLAGAFGQIGGVSVARIASWDGIAIQPVGGGVSGTFAHLQSLAVFDDDGSGPLPPALFAGGTFSKAGGVSAVNIAAWDGASWRDVGGGVSGVLPTAVWVASLAAADPDGAGPAPESLYAGGTFTTAGPLQVKYLARWDGQNWHDVGSRTSAIGDLDGAGGDSLGLVVGGSFGKAGGVTALNLATWDGASFAPLFGGTNNDVLALQSVSATAAPWTQPMLIVGGEFTTAGSTESAGVAILVGCAPQCITDIDGDGKTCQGDLGAVLAAYGTCEGDPGYDPKANLFIGGSSATCIDQADLGALLGEYGCGGCP